MLSTLFNALNSPATAMACLISAALVAVGSWIVALGLAVSRRKRRAWRVALGGTAIALFLAAAGLFLVWSQITPVGFPG